MLLSSSKQVDPAPSLPPIINIIIINNILRNTLPRKSGTIMVDGPIWF